MTFEKALEAMKQGKKVRREFWDQDVCIGIDDTNIIKNMAYDSLYGYYVHYTPTELFSRDILSDDWEIYDPKSRYNRGKPVYNFRCKINIKPNKEETTMYTDLEITFKSGESITYSKGEWDDYSYDGKAVAVKKDGAWVGLYNFDNVFCVELKSRED